MKALEVIMPHIRPMSHLHDTLDQLGIDQGSFHYEYFMVLSSLEIKTSCIYDQILIAIDESDCDAKINYGHFQSTIYFRTREDVDKFLLVFYFKFDDSIKLVG